MMRQACAEQQAHHRDAAALMDMRKQPQWLRRVQREITGPLPRIRYQLRLLVIKNPFRHHDSLSVIERHAVQSCRRQIGDSHNLVNTQPLQQRVPQCSQTEIIFYGTRVNEKFCNDRCDYDDVL